MSYEILEGVQQAVEGEDWLRNLRVPSRTGATPTITSPVMYVYKNGTDYTSTYTTGSMSVSGDLITLKTITSLVGGDRLRVSVFATVDSITNQCVGRFWLDVLKKGA